MDPIAEAKLIQVFHEGGLELAASNDGFIMSSRRFWDFAASYYRFNLSGQISACTDEDFIP